MCWFTHQLFILSSTSLAWWIINFGAVATTLKLQSVITHATSNTLQFSGSNPVICKKEPLLINWHYYYKTHYKCKNPQVYLLSKYPTSYHGIATVTESEQDVESIMEKMEEVMGNKNNMRINKIKTKVMVYNRDEHTRSYFNSK